jgi:hypothetical protein
MSDFPVYKSAESGFSSEESQLTMDPEFDNYNLKNIDKVVVRHGAIGSLRSVIPDNQTDSDESSIAAFWQEFSIEAEFSRLTFQIPILEEKIR